MKAFYDLHADVVDEIFSYLDVKSLKNAMEVCKKWHELIGGNSSTMKKFKFRLPYNWRYEWTRNIEEVKAMSRFITTVQCSSVQYDNIENPKICEVLKKLEKQIKVLILCGHIHAVIFNKLVSMLQLEKLIVTNLRIFGQVGNYHSQNANATSPAKLIVISNCNAMTMKTLAKMKLQSPKLVVEIETPRYEDLSYFDPEPLHLSETLKQQFTSLMQHQRNLKELVIKLPAKKSLMGRMINALKHLKLEKLAIYLEFETYKPNKYDGLAELITTQPALREIEIRADTISQSSINALYHTAELQKLTLDIKEFPTNIAISAACVPHSNLKTLIIKRLWAENSEKSIDSIFQMFANVETLGIDTRTSEIALSEIMQSAQNHLKSLKYIKSGFMFNSMDAAVHIPSLQKLQVGVAWFSCVQQFLSKNASLEELEIENIQYSITNKAGMIELPCQLANLKRLTIGYRGTKEFKINKAALRRLEESCPALLTAEVGSCTNLSIADDVTDNSSIKVAKFNKDSNVFKFFSKSSFEYYDDDLKSLRWIDEEAEESFAEHTDDESWDPYDKDNIDSETDADD